MLRAGIVTVRRDDAKGMFYQDLDDTVAAELAKESQPKALELSENS